MKMAILSILLGVIVAIVLIRGLDMINKQRNLIEKSQFEIDSLEKQSKQLRIEFGRSLFLANCSMCHAGRGGSDNLLEDIVNRMGEDYLKLYLTKQDSLIASRNTHAMALKKEFGNTANNHNFKFTAPELQALIEYLR
jgi:mono/diheme cytochrome c family protein